MGIVKRLLDDAESFAKEAASLDEEGFISRTLAYLGVPAEDSDVISGQEQQAPGGPAAPSGRARPGPDGLTSS